MPIYEYRSESGETIEELYYRYEDSPSEIERDGETFKRVPSVTTAHFTDPQRKAEAKRGIVPVEPGMDKDADRAKKDRKRKQTEKRHEAINKTLGEFGLS